MRSYALGLFPSFVDLPIHHRHPWFYLSSPEGAGHEHIGRPLTEPKRALSLTARVDPVGMSARDLFGLSFVVGQLFRNDDGLLGKDGGGFVEALDNHVLRPASHLAGSAFPVRPAKNLDFDK